MDKQEVLRTYFGFSGFRDGQDEIIDRILSGQDVMCIMPTGAGKSVCYQVPALLLDGITIVVSPLISLMKDQVTSLIQAGVRAAYLNSSLSEKKYEKALRQAFDGMYKIIYVAPERLLTNSFIDFSRSVKISMVTIDEAHCVSQWGHDFRPSYLKIADYLDQLSYRPIVSAFTATATKEISEDIVRILRLQDPYRITTGFNRENLYFEVQQPLDKMKSLLDIVNMNEGKCGIVYCSTRKSVEDVSSALSRKGFSVTRYHAGLEDTERKENQEAFAGGLAKIIVATNAFGMGIDKSDVSFVVHYNMPKSIEGYYQEAGRAGRDGSPAQCVLLYDVSDVKIIKYIMDLAPDNPVLDEVMRQAVKQKELERLNYMIEYCSRKTCLREYILAYFGAKSGSICGNCSNCRRAAKPLQIIKIAPGAVGEGAGVQPQSAVPRAAETVSAAGKKSCVCDSRTPVDFSFDIELFKKLGDLRMIFSRRDRVSAASVFPDEGIREMCLQLPMTENELVKIPGITLSRKQKYGKEFVAVIQEHLKK